jgi:hypothetical protein
MHFVSQQSNYHHINPSIKRFFARTAAIALFAALPAAMPAATFLLSSTDLSFGAVMNNGANLLMSASNLIGNIGIGTGTEQITGGCSGNCTVSGVVDYSTSLNGSSGGYSVPTGDTISGTTLGGTAYNPSLVSTVTGDYLSLSNSVKSLTGTTLDLSTIANGAVIQATSGIAHTVNGQTVYVFNVTNGQVAHPFTINGAAGVNVVFNYAGTNLNFNNTSVSLSGGISSAQVIWNLTCASCSNVLTSTGSASSNVVNGLFLMPTSGFNLSGITVDGLVYGGLSGASNYISNSKIVDAPVASPEPASLTLAVGGIALAALSLRRRARRKA